MVADTKIITRHFRDGLLNFVDAMVPTHLRPGPVLRASDDGVRDLVKELATNLESLHALAVQASVLVGRPCPVPEYITELLARAKAVHGG